MRMTNCTIGRLWPHKAPQPTFPFPVVEDAKALKEAAAASKKRGESIIDQNQLASFMV